MACDAGTSGGEAVPVETPRRRRPLHRIWSRPEEAAATPVLTVGERVPAPGGQSRLGLAAWRQQRSARAVGGDVAVGGPGRPGLAEWRQRPRTLWKGTARAPWPSSAEAATQVGLAGGACPRWPGDATPFDSLFDSLSDFLSSNLYLISSSILIFEVHTRNDGFIFLIRELLSY